MGGLLLTALLAAAVGLGGCESPGKRPRTTTKRTAGAGNDVAKSDRVTPPMASPKADDYKVFDENLPCLNRGQARRGQIVLLGKRNRTDLEQWMLAINKVFFDLKVDCSDDHFLLLAITTIQMESNVRVDPAVANTNLEELYANRLKRFRSEHVLEAQLLNVSGLDDVVRKKLRNDTRKHTVRTEADLDRYVETDFRPWLLKTLKTDYLLPEGMATSIVTKALPDPVHTIGPMQVDFNKAFKMAKKRGEPIASAYAMKRLLFEPDTAMERGLKEGVYLLWINYHFYRDVLPPEEAVFYTAADYNAGEFSSRNAAFQDRLSLLSGRKLTLDGDLLMYTKDGQAESTRSQTEEAAAMVLQSGLSPSAVRRDLMYEKEESFALTATNKKVCELYEAKTKNPCTPARLPSGAGNPSAEVKSGITYTPANYAYAYRKRFQSNWINYLDPT
ncbi:MAG TPA: DUF1615 family protein, partial [bacterium]